MIQMFPLKKIYVGHAALISYSEKALWSPSKETLRLVRQPICTPWFVIWSVPLWEFSETLSREAIILSTPHTPGAGVRTWSLEAVQLNLYHNAGLEHTGWVGSAPDTAKAVVLKSCQKQPAAQHPGRWCCTNDAQWMAQISREGESQTVLAESLSWSRECLQLSPSTWSILLCEVLSSWKIAYCMAGVIGMSEN